MVYRLKTKKGATSKLFKNIKEAWDFLKNDCPDLRPIDFMKPVIKFADGYSLHKSYS